MKCERIIEDGKAYIQIPYYREDGKTTVFPEYEMNILESAQIEGMLKAMKRSIKGEVYFLFPIISCITLKEKFYSEFLNKESFCQFFEELLQVFENMQIYLLDKKLICLEPENIFFNEKENRYFFLPAGMNENNNLDNYEALFTFFADICSVEEKELLEFIFETFSVLDRSSFDETEFLKTIVQYKYRKKEQEEIGEEVVSEDFDFEDECEAAEIPKIKGTLLAGIFLLLLAFWFSFMCKEEFRYAVAGMAACLLAIGLLGYEVLKKVMGTDRQKAT